MALSVLYSLKILHEIQRINSIKDFGERTDAFIFGKQKIHEEIKSAVNDQLDELFSRVELGRAPKNNVEKYAELITTKEIINGLSIFLDREEQSRYEYEQLFSFMEEYLDGLYWYDKEIVGLYLKLGNYRDIEKVTRIPFTSCYRTVQRVISDLREEAHKKFETDIPDNKKISRVEW